MPRGKASAPKVSVSVFDGTLPSPVDDTVGFNLLVPDPSNPRNTDGKGFAGKIRKLARDLLARGQQDPFIVSRQSDGSLLLLRGHRRHKAIAMIRTEGIVGGDGFDPVPPMPDYCNQVPVRIYTGLTRTQELSIASDEGTTERLRSVERYLAAKRLFSEGVKLPSVALSLGISNSQANQFFMLYRLPADAEKAFMNGDIGVSDISKLYKEYGADQASKHGRAVPGEAGPLFSEKLAELTAGIKPPKALTQSEVDQLWPAIPEGPMGDALRAVVRYMFKEVREPSWPTLMKPFIPLDASASPIPAAGKPAKVRNNKG